MLRWLRHVLLPLTLLATLMPGATAQVDQGPALPRMGFSLIETSSTGLIFDLVVPDPMIEELTVEGRTYRRLRLADYVPWGPTGYPELLQVGAMIAIPPDAEVAVRILELEFKEWPEPILLYPVPVQEARVETTPQGETRAAGVVERFAGEAEGYTSEVFVPEEVIGVEDAGYLRQQRVARLVVRPFLYRASTGTLRHATSLRVAVDFVGQPATAPTAEGSVPPVDRYESVLRSQLLNYEQGIAWRAQRQELPPKQAGLLDGYPGDTSRPWFKSEIRRNGLYRVTLADLRAPELTPLADADPTFLQIWQDGQQLPTHFLGDGDASFEEDEALIFYGRVEPTIYSHTAVIWFTVGDSPGMRMTIVDGVPGAGTPETSLPAQVRLEADLLFRGNTPPHAYGELDHPRWYWMELETNHHPERVVEAFLPTATIDGDATLRIRVVGGFSWPLTALDHQVQIEINGHLVGDVTSDGFDPALGTITFPAAILEAGRNNIRLRVPGNLTPLGDQVYLDWIELSYLQGPVAVFDELAFTLQGSGRHEFFLTGFSGPGVQVYDVTDPVAPRRVTGGQPETSHGALRTSSTAGAQLMANRRIFLPASGGSPRPVAGDAAIRFGGTLSGTNSFAAARPQAMATVGPLRRDVGSELHSTDRQADYLLISHGELSEAAQALASHRRSHGLSVATIDVQDIYDEFSGGRLDPMAIRAFINHAYHYWQEPAPAYVLLLGDGHYDNRLVTGVTTVPSYIPPIFACVDIYRCETAIDNHFVTVSGTDLLPDMAIGRLPARSLDSALRMVGKIINYETAPEPGSWRQTVVFVADNYHDANGIPDDAGDFVTLSEAVIDQVPGSYTVERVYYDPYPIDDDGEPYRYRTPQETTQAVIAAINAGQVMVNYSGHGAPTTWAVEQILRSRPDLPSGRNDVTQMVNGARLPFFLDMTCLTGDFADIQFPSIQRTLLDWDQGGSIGGWAATGLGVATGHDALHRGFFAAVFADGTLEVGLAADAGKAELWSTGQSYDLLDTFVLLADPAMRLNLPT
jgi:hypothetical protein